MTTKIVVIFYSLYTHTWQLAQAIVEGAKEVEDIEVELYQVPETLPPEVIKRMGATQPKEAMKDVKIITEDIRKEVIKSADAILFGSPTRFGCMTAQMKAFFDNLGGLWFEDACVGKVASCFTGSGTQHGGQETTLLSMMAPLLHLGFIYVGLPYSCKEQKEMKEITGGSPYGATFIAGSDGSRAVSANEKSCARFQGRHVAQIAKALKLGRLEMGPVAGPPPVEGTEDKPAEKKPDEKKSDKNDTKKKPPKGTKKTKKKPEKGDKKTADGDKKKKK